MKVAELQTALARADKPLAAGTLVPVSAGDGTTVRVVLETPDHLAARAGLSREAYALARCIRSEGYGGDGVGRAAAAVVIGQAIKNGAALSGATIERKLTRSTFPEADGYYGEQRGRYASTTLGPTEWTARVAEAVLAGNVPDLARGAHKFVDPAVFAKGEQAGRRLRAFADVMTDWVVDEGNLWRGHIPTVDSFHLVVLGRPTLGFSSTAERKRHVDQLVEVYEEGKAGRHGPAPGSPDAMGGLAVAGIAGAALAGLYWLVSS